MNELFFQITLRLLFSYLLNSNPRFEQYNHVTIPNSVVCSQFCKKLVPLELFPLFLSTKRTISITSSGYDYHQRIMLCFAGLVLIDSDCLAAYCEPLRYLRNRKHFPYFYRVIETRVEVWENEKCCGNTSRRRVFPQLFRVLPNLYECFYNSIETRRKCFLFLLENSPRKITKNEENLIVLFIIKT